MNDKICEYCDCLLEDCICDEWEDYYDDDNGPTGHDDICYSDADPGL